jgi:hypothetical protein
VLKSLQFEVHLKHLFVFAGEEEICELNRRVGIGADSPFLNNTLIRKYESTVP